MFAKISELLITVCLLGRFKTHFVTHPVGSHSDTEQLWCWRIDASLYGGNEKGIKHVEYSIGLVVRRGSPNLPPMTCPSSPLHPAYLTLHARAPKPHPCPDIQLSHRPETCCISKCFSRQKHDMGFLLPGKAFKVARRAGEHITLEGHA